MPDDIEAIRAELQHLRERNQKLAEDKSYFQLLLRLMELLNPLPGLDDMLRGMLFNIVECIGGTNIKLYYWVGTELHYQDFVGEKKILAAIDDPAVARVFESHQFVEQRGGAEEALLRDGMLRGSWTWTFPLLVGQDLVGIIKLENLHIHGALLGKYLPIFFSHAALILANEIRNEAHRHSEDALRVATERLRLATEAGLIGIWDWDIVRDELVWDESMYRLYGRRSGDFGGAYQAWLSAVHPDDKSLAEDEIQAALRGEREYAPEFRVVWPDGSVHHIKAASRTIRDKQGKPLRMVGINFDLTERKRAEEAQRRLNRELRAISNCNQALIRAEDEPSLLKEICRIICDEAGYRMAWVGYAESGSAKAIRPMAWAGAEEGYLEHAAISWADDERGQGPSGTAIRSGQSCTVDDFATDPMVRPWREQALRRGYRSSVALPLKDASGRIFGELCIYSAEVAAFTPDEVRLMEELAGDLAFGIGVQRTRVLQRQAEAQLQASERRFRGLVENLPDLVVRYDTSLRRIYVNPAWEAASGLAANEVLAVPMDSIPKVPSPTVDEYVEALKQALATGTRREVEFSWVNALGATLHLQYVVVPECDQNGTVVSLLAVGRDITARKQAEEESRSHLRFLEALDRINRAIQTATDLDRMMADVLDEVLSIFDCDRAFLQYPCDPQATSWRVPMECNKPEYPGVLSLGHEVPMDPGVAGTFQLLLDADEPVMFGPGTANPLPEAVSRQYGFKTFLSMAVRPKTGKPWQFGIHQCSHARQWTPEEARLFEEIGRRLGDGLTMLLAQRELRDNEEKLGEAERIAHVGYVDRDLTGDRVTLSDETCRILGLPPARRVGGLARWNEAWLQQVHPEDRERIAEAFAAALREGSSYDQEYRVVRPDSEVRFVHSRAHVTRDDAGNAVRMLGTMQDITERKATEAELDRHRLHLEDLVAVRTRELAEARDAAESANRAKTVFLANMSHELRTPLNAILGFAQIMEMDARIPPDERSNLGTITRSGRHLLSLINDVLEISRIEAGRLKTLPGTFDLPDMLASVRDVVAMRAADKGLTLTMVPAPTLPRFVVSDAGKVRQVLLNLLSNAVKYTEHGDIELSVSTQDVGGQTQLVFVVRDTGVGIPEGDQERIFQPFYQTEYGVALGEGTGLGLTISREYAQLLGGSISVDSTPGCGSTFRFVVPVTLAEAPPETPTRSGRVVGLEADQAPCRVLVVEDDADSRNLLTLMLKQVDLRVHTADNGAEAVEDFLAWHPDFIWMDMRMPVMDGYEATRRIRALPGGSEVKIVALTASAFHEDRDEIIAAGCDDVLAKPFDEALLFGAMESLLGLRFRYAEAPAAPTVAAPTNLTDVPAELRAALRAAAQRLDVEATRLIIARVREIDGAAAAQLEGWADDYRYDRIVALCDEADAA
jgi:PAS domain S-box-containing protein